MINGVELNIRQPKTINIALWINHSDYRDAKDFFYHVKKLTPLPKEVDFDFAQHPRKYYHTKKVKTSQEKT